MWLGGVHFNALVEVKTYKAPDTSQFSVCTVSGGNENISSESCELENWVDEVDINEGALPDIDSILLVKNDIKCDHKSSSLPRVTASIDNCHLCALIDSGAQLSLISDSALGRLKNNENIEVVQMSVC